jgi:hypothetical protein
VGVRVRGRVRVRVRVFGSSPALARGDHATGTMPFEWQKSTYMVKV